MNANFGLVDDLATPIRDKIEKRVRIAERALADFTAWRDAHVTDAPCALPEVAMPALTAASAVA